jgi:hypothetical protein
MAGVVGVLVELQRSVVEHQKIVHIGKIRVKSCHIKIRRTEIGILHSIFVGFFHETESLPAYFRQRVPFGERERGYIR